MKSTRREFLKRASVTVAVPYVITSNALGAVGSLSASNRITTALIGSGGRGCQIIDGGDRVVTVCDVDAKHAEKAKAQIDKAAGNSSCTTCGDFREVLGRDDIDAVVVAVPDHWHVPIAAAAVKAGKAVYVEKPLSLFVDEGRQLAEIVNRYRAIVQVGSQQRSDQRFIHACELVRNGRIGELKTVKVGILTRSGSESGFSESWTPQPVPSELDYEMWLGQAPFAPYHPDRVHYKFRFVSDCSGGDVTNWGAHHLDIAQMGIGADDSGPVAVEGSGKRDPTGLHDAFYDVKVDFTYENGVKVELRSGGSGVRFEGTEGWIYVSRSKIDADPKSVLTSRLGPDAIRLGPKTGGGTHMGIWLDCVRSRSTRGLNVPVEVGHRSATVCHLANIAMELGRKLQWDPAAEQFVDDDEANRHCQRPIREPWKM